MCLYLLRIPPAIASSRAPPCDCDDRGALPAAAAEGPLSLPPTPPAPIGERLPLLLAVAAVATLLLVLALLMVLVRATCAAARCLATFWKAISAQSGEPPIAAPIEEEAEVGGVLGGVALAVFRLPLLLLLLPALRSGPLWGSCVLPPRFAVDGVAAAAAVAAEEEE